MVLIFLLYLLVDQFLVWQLPKRFNQNITILTRTIFLLVLSFGISLINYNQLANFRFALIYLLVFIRVTQLTIRLLKNTTSIKQFTWIYGVKQTVVLFVVFTPLFMFPVYTLSTTGVYEVNTQVKQYTFSDYDDPYNNENNRQINVQYWFPESRDEKSPLVIFSHGGISFKTSNESLFLELASHGYIVASIDHPSHSIYTRFNDDSATWIDINYLKDLLNENPRHDIENSFDLYQQWMDLRTQDISSYLNHVKEDYNNILNDSIDYTKIGVIGHSLGGSAALCMGRVLEEDIKVIVALESPFMCDIEGVDENTFVFTDTPYSKPLLNVYTDSLWDRLSTLPQYGQNDNYVQNDYSNIENLYIPNAGHFNLSDLALSSPLLTRFLNGFETKENHQILNDLNHEILTFLNQHLVD